MNQPINDGGPAFALGPTASTMKNDDGGCNMLVTHYGMERGISMRDYFAAAAMNGICNSRSHSDLKGHAIASARVAYELADAMLKAREAK